MILGVLLAAGQSRRYGPDDKLLSDWNGRALVSHAAHSLLASGCDRCLAVTSSLAVASVLPVDFAVITVPPGLPMSRSWFAAVRYAQETRAEQILFTLGDMPNIRPETLVRLVDMARETGSAACVHDGIAMPPACFPLGVCLGLLMTDDGDRGARPLLAALPGRALLPVTRDEALDIDRPSDHIRQP